MAHPYYTYTAEILSWRLGDSPPLPGAGGTSPDASQTAARTRRVLRTATHRQTVVLCGLGTGQLAAALADALPLATALVVVSLDPPAARRLFDAHALTWISPDGSRQLLADSSEQALFCLLAMAGVSPETALVTTNPEDATPGERQGLARLRRLLAESAPLAAEASFAAAPPPELTLAVMARPDEPDLSGFFDGCAGLASRAVILWDAPAVPEAASQASALGVPVSHLARPLARDFAAQRNALLAACQPGWVLTLDPDERPGPGFREIAWRLTATAGIGAAYFPRLTLFPDPGHAKVGHGLWPDLQLRLFSNAPPARPRYTRPVHERLEGLAGRAALALYAPLYHHNRLLADDEAVVAKLSAYNAASGAPRHRLSRDYPTLPLEFFANLTGKDAAARVLLLPALW